ncbi:hypothetical protein [Roseibium sp. MMSF_3412]|uniref:hypothetical protein n=1 Tax=Roseibium sp. MMSF_3412 TaxID=3046712 RepID=UPI00273DAF92|nr:hypothetical protein [Roseibium sp. MMSF_3412]
MKRVTWIAGLALCLLPAPGMAKNVTTETIQLETDGGSEAAPIPDDQLQIPQTATTPSSQNSDAPADLAPPQVLYNTAVLPKPVARMHAQLKEAAEYGDLQRIRMILESNELPPTLSFTEIGDPIDFLKESSGDGEGFEILAILADTLDSGFVHVDVGTPQEMYIWPYFARYPLQDLAPDQKVEMYRIITAGDFAEMEQFGAWTFYRVGIGPDGTLHYFVAGD